MEDLIVKLHGYGRFLELEAAIPHWEQQRAEQKTRLGELRLNRDQKKWDLDHLENPGFFRRLLGKTEENKEKRSKQLREVTAALNAAQWELDALEKQIECGKRELDALCDSREAYARAKAGAALSTIQESQLMMEELAAFTPAALTSAERVLEALEAARPWMRQDARQACASSGNRKMECLAMAARNARRLVEILSIMPEGSASIGSYLRMPEDYVTAVTSEFKQLDRLNNAMDQVRETRNQLRMLQ